MPGSLPSTSLKYSTIGSEEKISPFKTALREIPLHIDLFGSYNSVHSFLKSDIKSIEVDFIITDHESFEELERNTIAMPVPLIVLTDRLLELHPLYSKVFDTLPIPINPLFVEKKLNRFFTLKTFFKKEPYQENNINQSTSSASKTFLIKRGKEFQLLSTENIVAFSTDNKLTFAHDDSGTKFFIQSTLIELENQLNAKYFFRANRQFLVNRKYIDKIRQLDEGRFEIVFNSSNSLRIDINQHNFSKLKNWIENN